MTDTGRVERDAVACQVFAATFHRRARKAHGRGDSLLAAELQLRAGMYAARGMLHMGIPHPFIKDKTTPQEEL